MSKASHNPFFRTCAYSISWFSSILLAAVQNMSCKSTL